jgi:hypothetical protein
MMNEQPASLGFFSAFLITWIFILYPFSSRVYGQSNLLARLRQLFDDERAARVARLLFCLLDHLNLHHLKSPRMLNGYGARRLAQVLDRDVDKPGAQRAFFLVRFFAFVLHGLSPSELSTV